MTKTTFFKLCALAIVISMALSMFACDKTDDPQTPTDTDTDVTTEAPTQKETEAPTQKETEAPTQKETEAPTQKETEAPTQKETEAPTQGSEAPSQGESETQAQSETTADTTTTEGGDTVVTEEQPTEKPTEEPTEKPTEKPTEEPTEKPTEKPTEEPTEKPTEEPTEKPTEKPTEETTEKPTEETTETPTEAPTEAPVLEYPAENIANDWVTYFNTNAASGECGHELLEEDGIKFVRITGDVANSTSQLFLVANYWQTNGLMQRGTSKNVANSTLLVIKLRTNTAETIQLYVSGTKETHEEPDLKNTKVALKFITAADSDWSYYVVDLLSLVPSWQPDNHGNYNLHTMYFHIANHASTDNVDIAYISFCDTWSDVKEITGQSEVTKLLKADGSSTAKVDAETGGCISHVLTSSKNEAGGFDLICEICHNTERTVNATYYKTATDIMAITTATKDATWFNDSSATWSVVTEGGASYISYNHNKASGGLITFSGFNNTSTEVPAFNSGRYAVMKFRVQNGVKTMRFQVATGEDTTPSKTLRSFTSLDNGWQIAVIDLAQFSDVYETNKENVTYACFGVWTDSSADTNATLDVEYFAVVSSLDDVDSIIDEDTFDYYEDWTQAPVKKNADGTDAAPEVIPEGNFDLELNAETLANNMFSYFNNGTSNWQCGHTLITDEDIPFARFTGGNGASDISQIFLVRNYWQGTACLNEGASVNVKDAYILVIKMRTNTAESVQLHIGGYKETAADPDNKNTKVGLTFKTVASEKDWTTYVVDLSALVPSWKADDNGDYMLHNCYFHIANHTSTDNVDVAYVAFCDSWDDVAAYTNEETAIKLLKADGTSTSKVNTADGNCAAHIYATVDGENGTKVVKCAVCGVVAKTVTATYYKTPDELAAIGTTGNWFNGTSETKVIAENGKTYVSYIHGSASGGCITFYKNNGKVEQGEEFNSGNYIVMKFRVTNGTKVITFQNATGEGSSVVNIRHEFNQTDNDWQVAVIDLSQFQNYTTDTVTNWAALGVVTGTSANTNATLDVEYFAIVSSLADVDSIIDEDTYDYYADWTQAPVEKSVTDTEEPGNNYELLIDADALANNMIDYFNTASSDYKPGHTLVTEDNISFARFTGSAANSITQVFFVKNYWQSNGCINAGESANVKDAYLLVIKMRTNTAESVQLHVGGYKETPADTENKGTKVAFTINTAASDKDWTTYVIDLSALVPSWKTDDNGDYNLHNLYFHIPNHASTDNIDVAYVAFCDSWADIAAVTGESTATKLTSTSGSTLSVNAATGDCATHAAVTENGENGTKILKCSACGEVLKTVTATYYKTAAELTAIGKTGNWFNGSSETKVVTEDGKTYASYIHGAATGGCITFYKENSKVAQGEEFNSGKYIVMKFRVRNGIGGLILQNATGEGSAVKGVKHTFTQSENGWQVAVIDLSQFQNYTTDTTTSWAALGLTTGASANTNATLDVEYFAIVSSLDNVDSIIDEDTYDYYADWTQAPVEKSVNAQ